MLFGTIGYKGLTHSRRRALLKNLRVVGAHAHNYCDEFLRVRVELPRAFLPATYRLLTTENGGYLHEVEDKASRVPLKVCFL